MVRPSLEMGKLEKKRVLAVDLLNPTPQAELRKHKLKVFPSSRFLTNIPSFIHPSTYPTPSPFKPKLTTFLQMLVPAPRSFFMDVKCPGCFTITTVFSHAQTVVICGGCSTVLCQPTGGKARLTEGCSFRRK
ncbi:MAG: hypothetical protein LQ346_004647 [Caloplaca aetnensis]|nr:MAG: hypothetical protein LQ346_004647 [Caloplaca aetnensis]